jgi:HSP20 family protein
MWWPEMARTVRTWNPLGEMQRLHDEVNRLFSRAVVPYTGNFPAVNIWTGDDEIVLTSEIPGLEPKDIDVSVVGNILTISGSRKPEELGDDESYHRQERAHGSFSRSIRLPYVVDSTAVEAGYEKGVLGLKLPRAQEDKPKKIEIKSR